MNSGETKKVWVHNSTQTKEPSNKMLAEGWLPNGYDYYQDCFYYKKLCGNELLEDIQIVFEKFPDKRDKNYFKFDDVYMLTSVTFPVMNEIRQEIFENIIAKKSLDTYGFGLIENIFYKKLLDIYGGITNLIEKEYFNLVKYNDLINVRFSNSAELYIAENSVFDKNLFIKYLDKPSKEEFYLETNYMNSRSRTLYHRCFDKTTNIIKNRLINV